jgi:1-deoxy-D-xylulose-5-phosphate synthase
MPNMTVLAPKDGKELADMLDYALTLDGPCAIRYPKGEAVDCTDEFCSPLTEGAGERLHYGNDVELFAVGKMVSIGIEACKKLKSRGIEAGLTNVRFVKPLDKDSILSAAEQVKKIVTLEDNVLDGGYGAMVTGLLAEEGKLDVKVLNIGWPDKFIEQGSTSELFMKYRLDSESIAERVCDFLEGKA